MKKYVKKFLLILNIKSLKKINLRTFHKNDYWQINKNKSYIVKRYIDDPDNVYYHDTYQHDNKQSSIIFKFIKNSINIMDVFTNKNFFNLHLEKFLKNINNKNLKFNVLCNIYSDIYMIFILNNFGTIGFGIHFQPKRIKSNEPICIILTVAITFFKSNHILVIK